MQAHAVKTRLVKPNDDIETIIAESIATLEERSVLVVASKIFSFCENRLVAKVTTEKSEKWELAKKEADLWLHPDESIYQCMLTVKGNWIFANAGIDDSNAGGNNFVLWPKNPQASVNQVWKFLHQHYGLKEVGVIMSDSRSMPLNWGVMGHGIAYCGFEPLYSYIDQPDLFGRLMQMEQASVVQSLVSTGTLVMGEGNEMTPMAVITDIPRINFVDHEPSMEEINLLKPSITDDIFAPLLTRAPWNKGEGGIK
jgi:dihydrofolate synthase / folylpolyglutamate synthase